MSYPPTLEMEPLSRPPAATIRVPGSKSISNRALILAALSDPNRGSTLQGVLQSEDTEVMVEALRHLGFRIQADWATSTIHVRRGASARIIPAREADLWVANSGTTMRFLTALVSLGQGRYRLDGVARMRERPIEDLLLALRQMGIRAYCERDDGHPPVIVETEGLGGGQVTIKGNVSSQFLSGLLMAVPAAREETILDVQDGLVSWPYVAMTVAMMKQFGVELETDSGTHFRVPGGKLYRSMTYEIEPDASAAGYFFAAAAITGGEVEVPGLSTQSLQGDLRFVDILEKMGCKVYRAETSLKIKGGPLHGIEVDMNDISDCVMTLGAVACFAEGPTTIRNVAHIRYKETDRLHALVRELDRAGAGVQELDDGLVITPKTLHSATFETYNDHRMAMSLALLGLRVPGVVIANPACVAKTYPHFFDDLELLRKSAEITVEG